MVFKKILIVCLGLFLLLISGCIESRFQLSGKSRMPKWFSDIKEDDRNKYNVKLYFFTSGETIVQLYNKYSMEIIDKLNSMSRIYICGDSLVEELPKEYPIYMVLKLDGITDILEFRYMESTFYMTDNGPVWDVLRKAKSLGSD